MSGEETDHEQSEFLAAEESSVSLGASRTRRLVGGVASSIISRGVAALSPLLLVPITLNYLGSEIYGLWAAILSLTSMVLWADLGLGSGLLTQLIPVLTSGDRRSARKFIATGYTGLLVVSLTAILALAILAWAVPWSPILNINSASIIAKAPIMALITIGGFLLNMPLSLIIRVQYANQQVSQSNMWQASGSLVAVSAAWTMVHQDLGLYAVIGAVAAGPIISNVANNAWFYARNRDLMPTLREVDRTAAKPMFGLASQFLSVSILSSIALNADNFIIARTLGLDAVAAYSVPYRALTALGLLVTLINMPLWSANGEALARGDIAWVRRITGRMTIASGVGVLIPGVIVALAVDPIFKLWLGSDYDAPSRLLILLMTLWWTCTAAASPRFMVQNASGLVRPQIVGWAAYFVTSIPVKFVAALHFGLTGVIAGSVLCYMLTIWPTVILGYRSALKSRESIA